MPPATASSVITMPPSAISLPQLRSMPAVRMISVRPIAIVPTTITCCRISEKFCTDRKRSLCVAKQTTASGSAARREGIETVYQDLAVAPAMTIAENLFLGREIIKPGPIAKLFRIIDKKKMLEESIARMNDLKVGIRSMTQAVETLSGGQRQCVAVARSAAFARHVVILDEPTAALGVKEGNRVLDLIRRIRDKGLPVILISHNMPHVFEIADRIHIARLGKRACIPAVLEGTIGSDARAMGGVLLPLYANFAPDRELFLKLDR